MIRVRIRQELGRYLEECLDREFAFGTFDCALFVGEWCDRLTGSQLVREVRGKYNDPTSGCRVSNGHALKYAYRVLTGAGFTVSSMPRVGDIAFLHGGNLGLVYVLGDQLSVVTPSEARGLVFMPPEETINKALTWNG